MMLRAVFWIGMVSVLMPREPDLGYGSPGFGAVIAEKISDAVGTDTVPVAENEYRRAVSYRPRSLAEVKADIAAARHPQ